MAFVLVTDMEFVALGLLVVTGAIDAGVTAEVEPIPVPLTSIATVEGTEESTNGVICKLLPRTIFVQPIDVPAEAYPMEVSLVMVSVFVPEETGGLEAATAAVFVPAEVTAVLVDVPLGIDFDPVMERPVTMLFALMMALNIRLVPSNMFVVPLSDRMT